MPIKIDFEQIASPCFVLDEQALHNNLKVIDYVQKASGAKIILALKGFAMYSAFPLVSRYLPGTTASSLNEALLGKEEFGGEVHAYCPAYLEDEIDEILKICSHITFNSLSQWEKYKPKVQQAGQPLSTALRINPEFSEVEVDLYNPCAPGTRLGITAEQLGDTLPEGIEGLHFHTLCESGAEDLEKTLQAVEEKFGHLLHQAKWLNMGGGHLMTRKGYDLELLIELIKNLRQNYQLEIIMEPGSAVAWDTGYLVASVLDIVENRHIQTAMLDVSFSAHMPDCLEMPYQPRVLHSVNESKHKYRLGGLTCLAGDYMGDFYFEKALQVGDKIIFEDMIHYTMVKTTSFNGVGLPSIGIWKEDNTFQLVKKFGYEVYKNRLS
ncbi:carboxynorspermidine decarboxylase [Rapidithrix thailandica]|uniref:Carboxynorspermidine/carboxyspermidine decarboxylase n=1 Tax=Rapidithrix thailandica TaxID=413964 RepID=A0AAW9S7N3_9BACT